MDLGIKDKVALVTAASQGLGRAVAWRLSMEGAIVIICSRSLDKLKRTADEIAVDTGGKVKAITCDVTDENHVKEMIIEGYNQGELNHVGENDIENTGWWRILR